MRVLEYFKLSVHRALKPSHHRVNAPGNRLVGGKVPYAGVFTGTWDERVSGFAESDTDFSGATLLDVGCSLGVVDYELSKQRPAAVHGFDIHSESIAVAEAIFMAVDCPSRFRTLDLRDKVALKAEIGTAYDIVLYLAVDQHVRKQIGDAADDVAMHLLSLCNRHFFFRGTPDSERIFGKLAREAGFVEAFRQAPSDKIPPLIRCDRAA